MTDRTIDWVFRATDKTGAAFRSVDSKLAGITKSLRSFAGFAGFAAVAAGIGTLTKDLVQMGSELQDASEKLGVSAEKLQVLKFAAEQTGSSFDALQTALAFNTKLTAEAARGGKAAAETFRLLGIDAKKFEQIPIDRRLSVIASQLSKVQDPAKRLDLTIKALGRSGADLAPLMAQGAEGLARFDKELREANAILSDEQVQALADAGDAWEKFTLQLKVKAAPALTGTLSLLQSIGKAWDENNRRLGSGAAFPGGIPVDIVAPLDKGPGGRGREAGITPTMRASIIARAATAKSDEQIAAAEKAAAAAAKAQKVLSDAAAKADEEIAKLTGQIGAYSKEANSFFDEQGKAFSEKYKPAIDVLTEGVDEVNRLFLAGVINSETANQAIQELGDGYAGSIGGMVEKNEELKDSTDELLKSIQVAANGFARDLTDAFFDATQSIGEMFEQLAITIAKAIFTQTVTQPLITSILNKLPGAVPSGSSGGTGGGSLASWFPRAMGGPVSAGGRYLVGERGPELFVPSNGGTIVPNGSGEAPVSVNLTITSVDPQTAAQTIANQERLITGMIRRATLRAGRRPQLA